MLKLEEIKKDAKVIGIEVNEVVKVLSTELIGSDALTVYYKNSHGILGEQMLIRADESRLDLAEVGKPWAFDASGESFKLGLEAYRIQTTHPAIVLRGILVQQSKFSWRPLASATPESEVRPLSFSQHQDHLPKQNAEVAGEA